MLRYPGLEGPVGIGLFLVVLLVFNWTAIVTVRRGEDAKEYSACRRRNGHYSQGAKTREEPKLYSL